jgi:hypothetical protein
MSAEHHVEKRYFLIIKIDALINKFRISQHLLLIILKSTKKRIEVDYSVSVVLAKSYFNFISNINLDFLLIISLMGTSYSPYCYT